MAVTHGHGNPNWTRDEVILALDLYFDCKGRIPGQSDPRVKELSQVLRNFPHDSSAARKKSFRNPDGVAFKLQNLRQVASGKGLGNVSRTDREVWRELGQDPVQTKRLAMLIRTGVEIVESAGEDQMSDETFAEGAVVTSAHVRRERNPTLRVRLLKERQKFGELRCDVCGKCASDHSPQLGDAVFEAHHIVPLAAGQQRKTQVKDLALLCANCHKMVHRAIAKAKHWLSISEAKAEILGESGG